MKRIETGVALLLFALTVVLYSAGAARADPGIGVARSDLAVLRGWQERGRIEDLAEDPSHLPKPGYLILLRALLPGAGEEPREVRRFLVFNAVVVLGGLAVGTFALARGSGRRAALLFTAFGLLYLPARDCADYVGSEPLAIGLSLFFVAGLVAGGDPGPRRAILLGLVCAPILLMRPNLGWILLAVALVALIGGGGRRLFSSLGLLGGFFAGSILLLVAGRVAGLPTNPLAVNTSKAFLWGTADYYWPPDVGGWPVGKTPTESARLQMEKTKTRWKDFLARRSSDTGRSLLWRAVHAVLSSEELPPRWNDGPYIRVDKLLRAWWWLAAAGLCAAAAAVAAGGSMGLRLGPLLFLLACVAQGLVFGADPRLALPFIPPAVLALAAVWPKVRWTRRTAAAAAAAGVIVVLATFAVPDTADSDFVVLRGPGRRLEQEFPRSRFPSSSSATLHLRLLKSTTTALGLEILVGGQTLYRCQAKSTSATPAFLTLALNGDALERARRTGLRIEARTFGDASTKDAFYYFPAVAPIFRPACRIDGSADLPSGYGGSTRGSVPAWIHAGSD